MFAVADEAPARVAGDEHDRKRTSAAMATGEASANGWRAGMPPRERQDAKDYGAISYSRNGIFIPCPSLALVAVRGRAHALDASRRREEHRLGSDANAGCPHPHWQHPASKGPCTRR